MPRFMERGISIRGHRPIIDTQLDTRPIYPPPRDVRQSIDIGTIGRYRQAASDAGSRYRHQSRQIEANRGKLYPIHAMVFALRLCASRPDAVTPVSGRRDPSPVTDDARPWHVDHTPAIYIARVLSARLVALVSGWASPNTRWGRIAPPPCSVSCALGCDTLSHSVTLCHIACHPTTFQRK